MKNYVIEYVDPVTKGIKRLKISASSDATISKAIYDKVGPVQISRAEEIYEIQDNRTTEGLNNKMDNVFTPKGTKAFIPKGTKTLLTPEQEEYIKTKTNTIADAGKTNADAKKLDDGKLDWSLLPIDSVEEILKVLEFGKKKYSSWNWASNGGFNYTRVLNAMLRHLFAYIRGQDNDPETGLSHMAHLGCNVLFILYYIKHKEQFNKDDRFKQTT
jgi:hypothetical protein